MKKIVILSNHHAYTYNFRKEIIQRLIEEGNKIYVVLPYGEKVDLLKDMGCEYIDVPINRRGINPFTDLKLLSRYKKIIKDIKPDVVLTYTIKPNIYGGLAAKKYSIPYIANITGLGTAVEKKGILQKIAILFYKIAFTKIHRVFFQNQNNKKFFTDNGIAVDKHKLIPGSGVNLEHFKVMEYPPEDTTNFVFISRIMKEKGIEHYIKAAEYITGKYPTTKFHVCGFCEENYEERLEDLQKKGVLTYHGLIDDVRKIFRSTHCTIHPTFYPEGMSNVLLESIASGRPVIASDRSGCREIVDNGVNGYLVEQENTQDLIEKIEQFLSLSYQQKKQMGLAGRAKAEKEFDRQIVVQAYIDGINDI